MIQDELLIAPSILSANFANLSCDIEDVTQAGCDWIHVDVMDGHFVPNLTIGPVVIKDLRKITRLPLDVHLMIDEPLKYINDYRKAGADWITFHIEATEHVDETIEEIRNSGAKVGVSIKPKTPADVLIPILDRIDLVLIMSVEPGFGGQAFMPEQMSKIRSLREAGFKGRISVDGGIDPKTAEKAISQGADVLVAGSAIFGKDDRRAVIEAIRDTHREILSA